MSYWRIAAQLIAVFTAFGYAWAHPKSVVRIVVMPIAALIVFGMLMDQISARLCPEYFTILHPPIPNVEDPTLLGIAWGFLGSWWGGMFLGLGLAAICTAGTAPPIEPRELVKPLCVYVMLIALAALVVGIYAANMTPAADQFEQPWHRNATIVGSYHAAVYMSAIGLGTILCGWAAAHRRRRNR